MKKRIFIILSVAMLLVAIVTIEQIFLMTTFDYLKTETSAIKEEIFFATDINTESLIEKIDNLDGVWTKKESVLCWIVNHKDMEKIGEQIVKLKTLISQNKKQEAEYEVDLMVFYVNGYDHFVSVSFQNIF